MFEEKKDEGDGLTMAEELSCGCRLVWRGEFVHLYPCGDAHRSVARMTRQANSHTIIHEVGR